MEIDPTLKDASTQMFTAVAKGELDHLKTLLSEAGPDINLSDVQFLHRLSHENLLHWSLRNRQTHVAKYLIEECVVDVLCQEYNTFSTGLTSRKNALHKLTQLGESDLAKLLLKRVADDHIKLKLILAETYFKIPKQKPRTLNCLHIAAYVGNESLVDLYLGHGINVNVQNTKFDTALLWSTRWNHVGVSRQLLKRGADPTLETDRGSTPLYWAVRFKHPDMVRLLLEESDVDVNHKRKVGLVAPIVQAATLGVVDISELLLEHCADPNIADLNGETAIHHASREGHADVINVLLKHGANGDDSDSRGDTGLTFAAKNGKADAVRILLDAGADIWHTNYEGKDVWYYSIEHTEDDVLKVLVDFIQSKKSPDISEPVVDFQLQVKRSPICLAATIGACNKIEALLKLGIDPMDCDDDSNTFLHSAAKHDQSDVIRQFHAHISVNNQNVKGDTPLHIACRRGHHKTITSLIKCKPKTNIDNEHGETALHCAAMSETVLPKTIKILIDHTINIHNYDTLNDPDLVGNSPLHTAALHANEKVLWEFRSLSLKVTNDENESPFHVAVKSGNPWSLTTMLNIYDNKKRDADINEGDVKKQSVLHVAALARDSNNVLRIIQYGADVGMQDVDGNTALHSLAAAMAHDSKNSHTFMKIFNIILAESVRWWCNTNNMPYPSDSKSLYKEYKREAVLHLTNNIHNSSNLTVLTLAAKVGSSDVMERLLMMEGVTQMRAENGIMFDITDVIPLSSSKTGFCQSGGHSKRNESCLELMTALKSPIKAAAILNIPPIQQIESIYADVCRWAFSILITLHVVYMTVFSYVGSSLVREGQSNVNGTGFSANRILLYAFVPLEPTTVLLYILYAVCRNIHIEHGQLHVHFFHSHDEETKPGAVRKFFSKHLVMIVCTLYACLVISWVAVFGSNYVIQNYILSVSLLLGWLLTIPLTRGFQGIHYFFRMLQIMIVRDVFRFLLIYFFVLLAFSLCLHVIFQSSLALSQQYNSPLTTLFVVFNVMIGMADLFGDGFDEDMRESGYDPAFPKAIYMIYVVLSTIILLNLLIAMMNDSYQDILQQNQVTWRVDSVRLGLAIEKRFPILSCFFSKTLFYCEDKACGALSRWYITLPPQEAIEDRDQQVNVDEENILTSIVTQGLADLDTKMKESLEQVEGKLDSQLKEMRKLLDNIIENQKKCCTD